MTKETFSDFYQSLLELVRSYEKNEALLKVEQDLEKNIIKIFGKNITSLYRAQTGLDDVMELAYTTAEHHPYWALLYHCSQISKICVEKWDDEMARDELDEIEWSIKELQNSCEKLKENLKNS